MPKVALDTLQPGLLLHEILMLCSLVSFLSYFPHVGQCDHGVLLWRINCVPKKQDLPNLGAEVSVGQGRCSRFIRTP